MKDMASTLKYGGLFAKNERASEVYRPTGRNTSAEALICLNCPLPANECEPNVCQRYKDEKAKLRRVPYGRV